MWSWTARTSGSSVLANQVLTVFSWDATLGNDQILKARVSSASDINTNNNEDQLIVNVSRYQNSSVSNHDIPTPSGGGSSVVWSPTVHDFNVDVVNTGVKNQSAQFSSILPRLVIQATPSLPRLQSWAPFGLVPCMLVAPCPQPSTCSLMPRRSRGNTPSSEKCMPWAFRGRNRLNSSIRRLSFPRLILN